MTVHEIYFKNSGNNVYLKDETELGKDVKLHYNNTDTGVTFKCLTELDEISGNHYPLEFDYDLGSATGTVKTQYGTLSGVPIRIIGRYNSSVVIDTNYFGHKYWNYGGGGRNTFNSYLTGKVDPITSATYPTTPGGNIAPDGYPYVNFPLVDVVTFNKSTSSPGLVDMEVYVPMTTSSWFIKMECAGGSPSFYELQLSNKTDNNPCSLTEHYFTFTYTGNLEVGKFLSGYTITGDFGVDQFKILNSNEPSFPYGGGNYYIRVDKYDGKILNIVNCTATTTTTTAPISTTTTTLLISCGGTLEFTGNTATSGEMYPISIDCNLGTDIGTVTTIFNPYGVPDRLIIDAGGLSWDTSYRGGSEFNYNGSSRHKFNASLNGKIDPVTSQTYPFIDPNHADDNYPFVYGSGESGLINISIYKSTSTPVIWNFKIYSPTDPNNPYYNSGWDLSISCPV